MEKVVVQRHNTSKHRLYLLDGLLNQTHSMKVIKIFTYICIHTYIYVLMLTKCIYLDIYVDR